MSSSPQLSALDLDESTESAIDWVKANSRRLGIGAIAVAALAGIFWIVRMQGASREALAARELGAAQRAVATGNLAVAAADLQKVSDNFSSTRAGKDAGVLLATVLLQQGKGDDALKLLDKLGGSGPTGPSVLSLRGAAFEQLGKSAEAAEAYLKAAAANPLKGEAESLKADAARAFRAAGKKDEALKIWKEIAGNPQSVLYGEAALRIGELEAAK